TTPRTSTPSSRRSPLGSRPCRTSCARRPSGPPMPSSWRPRPVSPTKPSAARWCWPSAPPTRRSKRRGSRRPGSWRPPRRGAAPLAGEASEAESADEEWEDDAGEAEIEEDALPEEEAAPAATDEASVEATDEAVAAAEDEPVEQSTGPAPAEPPEDDAFMAEL